MTFSPGCSPCTSAVLMPCAVTSTTALALTAMTHSSPHPFSVLSRRTFKPPGMLLVQASDDMSYARWEPHKHQPINQAAVPLEPFWRSPYV